MEMLSFKLLSAFTLGVLGSVHCFGMCGGIISALSLRYNNERSFITHFLLLLCYNFGRITSYGIAGFFLGMVGWWVGNLSINAQLALRYLASVMLIIMGLYLANWWQGLVYLEQVGQYLWRYIQPITRYWLPIDTPLKALVTGILWGWLPCGLVYSTLFWSASAGDALSSSLVMVMFGLGTLPAMLTTGLVASHFQALISAAITRHISGAMMILFGLWTMPGIVLLIEKGFKLSQ